MHKLRATIIIIIKNSFGNKLEETTIGGCISCCCQIPLKMVEARQPERAPLVSLGAHTPPLNQFKRRPDIHIWNEQQQSWRDFLNLRYGKEREFKTNGIFIQISWFVCQMACSSFLLIDTKKDGIRYNCTPNEVLLWIAVLVGPKIMTSLEKDRHWRQHSEFIDLGHCELFLGWGNYW